MDLFTPYLPLGLKNRVVMAPMTRYNCTDTGAPTDDVAAYYIKRAQNQVGLIIVESCAVNATDAMGYVNGAQFHSEEHLEKWKPIVEEVHKTGAKIWIQLFHAGRLTVEEVAGVKPVAPSPVKTFQGKSFWREEKEGDILHFQTKTPFKTPIALEKDKIQTIIQQFADACALAEKAGFDGVELHGAHGYLLHQFCHTETNLRQDEYKADTKFSFVQQVVSACKRVVSENFVLAYRMSVHMVDSSYVRYDKEVLNYSILIKLLTDLGIDAFHSSELNAGSKMFGGEISLHELIRQYTDKPLIVCGNVASRKKAEKILTKGIADLVGIGRAFIPNPDLVIKFKERPEEKLIKFDYSQHIQSLI